ncbi:MAG: dihydrodipicolinate synthase family protein [Planctomycetes bacterium]|nr:dihydrodipicolinate synthase family protein [Planctomycetota bacterium]
MAGSEPRTISALRARLLAGCVIPAHPLALTSMRKLDERRQRALSRYYLEAGAGGLAAGVHTTQFAIHEPRVGLYGPVLELAADEAKRFLARPGSERPVLVAGIVGKTEQALREARLARSLGFDCGLLSLTGLRDEPDEACLEHARAVAAEIPLFGFYLQPAVGGRELSHRFWRRFCELEAVVAIKVAPFDRYRTLDVVRAVAESGRSGEIALYTGNDDAILLDLLTEHRVATPAGEARLRFSGGLLGQWAVWTRRAVELHAEARRVAASGEPIPADWLALNAQLTDANAAIFDAAHRFKGCIPGIHEVLRRQGFLEGRWCLDPREELSRGQVEEIDRVARAYLHLADDAFVRERLGRWLE